MRTYAIILLSVIAMQPGAAQDISADDQVRQSITKFYRWYIRSGHSEVKCVEGTKGMTRLDNDRYFRSLDSLGVLSPEFVKSERKRFAPCADFLRKVPWTEYSRAELGTYEEKCGFLYVYYWTGGHELPDGVEVLRVLINKNSAKAEVNLYYASNARAGKVFPASLVLSGGTWKIVSIDNLTN